MPPLSAEKTRSILSIFLWSMQLARSLKIFGKKRLLIQEPSLRSGLSFDQNPLPHKSPRLPCLEKWSKLANLIDQNGNGESPAEPDPAPPERKRNLLAALEANLSSPQSSGVFYTVFTKTVISRCLTPITGLDPGSKIKPTCFWLTLDTGSSPAWR